MLLTEHKTTNGSHWAVDGHFLPPSLNLSTLLEMPREKMNQMLKIPSNAEPATGEDEAPIDPHQEVWAAGVTYLRSREARKAESTVADMYQKVYEAERPEIFSKSLGWRVSGNGAPIRIRKDSHWNVPEPELVLVINRYNEIVGYCAGNDVSSRDIEGENPLYLPQAKIYNGSCALGHGILICEADEIKDIPIGLQVRRADKIIFDFLSHKRLARSLRWIGWLVEKCWPVLPSMFSLKRV
ncbi:MAG: fumarylacetoacetate hydrolase, partial [Anaerolineae bacterium]|nr:fumarylacetoacetate hydrolase [Anaerolineae bacterium]